MDNSLVKTKELSNDEIINNILELTNLIVENYSEEFNIEVNDIYESVKFYLERFYSLTRYDYENKNSDFYNPISKVKSYPIINESENEFKLRKTVNISAIWIWNIS